MSFGIAWIFIKHYAGLAFKFIAKYPWQILAVMLAIAAYLGWSNASKWEGRANREKAAHAQSIKNWKNASAKARQKNLEEVRAIEARQNQIIKKETIRYVKVKDDFRGNVADRLANGLRVNPQVDSGDAGTSGIPVISKMPGGTLRDAEAAIVSRTDLEIVAENQAKLEALIAAWRALESPE